MNKPSVSIVVPTFQRFELLQELLLPSLIKQTDPEFELLLIEDRPVDNRRETFIEWLRTNPLPFKIRFLSVKGQREPNEKSAGALPENAGFYSARGDIIIHLNDDVWVDPNLVDYVKKLDLLEHPACYYGQLIFMSKDLSRILEQDSRRRFLGLSRGPVIRSSSKDYLSRPQVVKATKEDLYKIPPTSTIAWGAMYVIPRSILLEMGGNDLLYAKYRGTDARLGSRLLKRVPCFFSVNKALRCWHYGLSFIREPKNSPYLTNIKEIIKSPSLERLDLPVIVNGGIDYWKDNWFKENIEFCYEN